MVSISRPIVPAMPTPRYTIPISFASRHIYTTFMMSVALVYAIISIHMVSATYLTPGDCPIQHCLLEVHQPEIDYFPLKLTTQQNPNFAIQYYNHFKVLKNLWTKEDYVITLCGTPVPTNNSMVYRTIEGKVTQVPLVLAPTAKFVTGPITKVAIDETITANMMELLGARRTIAAMDLTFITSPCLHAMKNLQVLPTFPGSWGNVTLRQQLIDQVDLVIGGNTPNAKPKFIQASVTAELKPQGRLEWVKFIGALLNREYAAQLIYDETLQRYNQLKAQAATAANGTSPIVAWLDFQKGNPAWGTVDAWKISVADYKLQYTRDAAATPFVPTTTSFTDPNQLIQTLIDGNVDIVIDETYIKYYAETQQTFEDFLRVWNITNTVNAKFIQQKQVWRHDRMQTAAGGDDWFERAVIQIDAVLQDMISFIHPNKVVAKDTPRVWFRDFVAGEEFFQTVDRCMDISAPLFPLLATPLDKTAPCPTLPIETFVGYKPISSSSGITSSTGVASSTGGAAKPSNGGAQIGAGIISIVSIIMTVLLM